MQNTLWLIPASPLLGFLVLALGGGRLKRNATTGITLAAMGLSLLITLLTAAAFISSGDTEWTQTLWVWMQVANLEPAIGLRLDALSLIMTLVVTFVGFLIHLYSTAYMKDDPGFTRFFAYLNLFVTAMLILLLADNLVLLYLGWEGVGLCSYLLIGFWYNDPANGRAAWAMPLWPLASFCFLLNWVHCIYKPSCNKRQSNGRPHHPWPLPPPRF